MISRLPNWVKYGAFLLTLLAGIVNSVGLLSFQHQAVSHVSGTATLLGVSLTDSHYGTVHLLMIMVSFLMGAIVSGFFIEGTALKLGRHYGVALLFEVLLLIGAWWLLRNDISGGQYLASMACGLQNAMLTTFSGAIIRTTHMTGIITDLGIMLGAWLRGKPFDKTKATLFFSLLTGFVLGGSIGAVCYANFEINTLLLPAAIALLLATFYWGIQARASQ